MEPSVLEAPATAAKPAKWWILLVGAAGMIGSLASVAGAGSGTYDITPFTVRFNAIPAPLGETVLEVQPLEEAGITVPLRAEAGTHASPLVAKATILGASANVVSSDRALLADPYDLAEFLGEEGKSAVRAFAVKVGGLAVAGGAGAGLLLSFGRWRRVLGGAVAGLLTFAVIGVLTQQSYDATEFQKTQFVVQPGAIVPEGGVTDILPSGLPT